MTRPSTEPEAIDPELVPGRRGLLTRIALFLLSRRCPSPSTCCRPLGSANMSRWRPSPPRPCSACWEPVAEARPGGVMAAALSQRADLGGSTGCPAGGVDEPGRRTGVFARDLRQHRVGQRGHDEAHARAHDDQRKRHLPGGDGQAVPLGLPDVEQYPDRHDQRARLEHLAPKRGTSSCTDMPAAADRDRERDPGQTRPQRAPSPGRPACTASQPGRRCRGRPRRRSGRRCPRRSSSP